MPVALVEVDGIWVRPVTSSNFFDIERERHQRGGGGGSSLYIDIPSSHVPDLLDLLGHDAETEFTGFEIPTGVVGAPDVDAPLIWAPKSGGRMRLFQNRQSGPDIRHPAWRAARGFPMAADSIASTDEARAVLDGVGGLVVYVVKTKAGDFLAGFLTGEYPADWPDQGDLRGLFSDGGVVRFDGLLLEPADQTRPFRADPGDVGVAGTDPAAVPEADAAAAVAPTSYASPEHSQEVDRIAMDRAIEVVTQRFPGSTVERMPHNNPGFDVRVSDDGEVRRYVEVKGTTSPLPVFFLSENERQFAEDHAEQYSLLVLHSVDLEEETAVAVWRDGALVGDDVVLTVSQHRGRLISDVH